MFISTFDIFKIGIGPSSSHTMGPMVAANRFVDALATGNHGQFSTGDIARLQVTLYGSLAYTGKGHATDTAIILGLDGCTPATVDPHESRQQVQAVGNSKTITPPGLHKISFDPETDIDFCFGDPLPGHPNGMKFCALTAGNLTLFEQIYYSIGGGFVVTESELESSKVNRASAVDDDMAQRMPYPFCTASEMLQMGDLSNLTIAQMKEANEKAIQSEDVYIKKLDAVISTMFETIDRGLKAQGILPGGLFVERRARKIHDRLLANDRANASQPHEITDWLCVYAMAVNEENAGGGRVVTSPTNGAAGVVPSVLRYYRDHCIGSTGACVHDFINTAAAIGGLVKHNAHISGAEGGCQAEVGSASAMAAAGLCAALGGSNHQIENAAEIALEHHLGMTCDPVEGLVQIPCIERNGMGAVKAVSAASLALHGDGKHYMPLDNCIETMRQTGIDMNSKYKETSQGGLAVNLPAC